MDDSYARHNHDLIKSQAKLRPIAQRHGAPCHRLSGCPTHTTVLFTVPEAAVETGGGDRAVPWKGALHGWGRWRFMSSQPWMTHTLSDAPRRGSDATSSTLLLPLLLLLSYHHSRHISHDMTCIVQWNTTTTTPWNTIPQKEIRRENERERGSFFRVTPSLIQIDATNDLFLCPMQAACAFRHATERPHGA